MKKTWKSLRAAWLMPFLLGSSPALAFNFNDSAPAAADGEQVEDSVVTLSGKGVPLPVPRPGATPDSQPAPAPAPGKAPTVAVTGLAALIKQRVEQSEVISVAGHAIKTATLKELYKARDFEPIWITDKASKELAGTLRMILVDESEDRGLNPRDYWVSPMDSLMDSREVSALVEFELLASLGYVQYAKDTATGRIDPRDGSQNLDDIDKNIKRDYRDYIYMNHIAQDHETLVRGLRRLEPRTGEYQALLKALERLRASAELGGWPEFWDQTVLKPGMEHANVQGVRRRLIDFGALPVSERNNTSQVYDGNLVRAVQRLQQVTYQKADGVIGAATYKILNVPLRDRIQQTRANIERWRYMPRSFVDPKKVEAGQNDRYIFIDLGRQELDVVEWNAGSRDMKVSMRMRVVVGRDARSTPTLVDRITSLIVRPYWYAPKSIVAKDIVKAMQANRGYLRSARIRVFGAQGEVSNPENLPWGRYSESNPPPYEFRQEPGQENSLGLLRFSLTNNRAIYLHDTNHKEYFQYSIRYFSSGCIRLEHPFELADYLMRDQATSGDEIRLLSEDPGVIAREVKIPRESQVRVYIFGSTMTLYRDGMIGFVDDIYTQDRRIIEAMNRPK
ncbi:MAG: L,D-transpeptidase family protein [Bdellovibrionaceae bacterium]|nr:L,D-transpeptidase family protein [Pseudobdellovibrionaceae bacterium]